MIEIEGKLEFLQRLSEVGLERFERDKGLMMRFVDEVVKPALVDVLGDLIGKIDRRHWIEEADSEEWTYAIHYTSLDALVSLLQRTDDDEGISSLRLYDSVHFNDPDEGNCLLRYMDLSKEHDWLGEAPTHAYVVSFIRPKCDPRKDMSDNLVFWRSYGQEGEGCSLSLRLPKRKLRKVLYGVERVTETLELLKVNSVLKSLNPLVSITNPYIADELQTRLAAIVWSMLADIRFLYKSEAYEYERECRLVVPERAAVEKGKGVQFTNERGAVAPAKTRHYCEVKELSVDQILVTDSSITLGPCVPNEYNVKYYLESLLKKVKLART